MSLHEAAATFSVQGLDLSAPDARQERAFQNCLAFPSDIPKAEEQNPKFGSYGFKHRVEVPTKYAGTREVRGVDTGCYVYGGPFILAALASGFTMRQPWKGELRVSFNLSQPGLQKRLDEILDKGGL